jgi:hypothetical protein
LRNDVGRNVVTELCENVGDRIDTTALEQERTDTKRALRGEHTEDDLAFGDEQAVTTNEIALAHRRVGLERGLGSGVELNETSRHQSADRDSLVFRVSRVTAGP